jgi:hypothetical protein
MTTQALMPDDRVAGVLEVSASAEVSGAAEEAHDAPMSSAEVMALQRPGYS